MHSCGRSDWPSVVPLPTLPSCLPAFAAPLGLTRSKLNLTRSFVSTGTTKASTALVLSLETESSCTRLRTKYAFYTHTPYNLLDGNSHMVGPRGRPASTRGSVLNTLPPGPRRVAQQRFVKA
eukprot:scaffold36337_cov118-Isochrysis_galbana.AAC.2